MWTNNPTFLLSGQLTGNSIFWSSNCSLTIWQSLWVKTSLKFSHPGFDTQLTQHCSSKNYIQSCDAFDYHNVTMINLIMIPCFSCFWLSQCDNEHDLQALTRSTRGIVASITSTRPTFTHPTGLSPALTLQPALRWDSDHHDYDHYDCHHDHDHHDLSKCTEPFISSKWPIQRRWFKIESFSQKCCKFSPFTAV